MMPVNAEAPDVPEGIHINIGCGKKLWPGFVNVDAPGNWSGKAPDMECDIRQLTLPTDYADSAWAIHVLEHFYRYETVEVLKEWRRILKPGGALVVEVPCLDNVLKVYFHALKNGIAPDDRATIWRLYGDPGYKDASMVHRWCFSQAELVEVMQEAGFSEVTLQKAYYHTPALDMRVVGVK